MPANEIAGNAPQPGFTFAVILGRARVTGGLAARLLQKVVGRVPVTSHAYEDKPVQGSSALIENVLQRVPLVAGTFSSIDRLDVLDRYGNLHVEASALEAFSAFYCNYAPSESNPSR
jgi:hypothetical protein